MSGGRSRISPSKRRSGTIVLVEKIRREPAKPVVPPGHAPKPVIPDFLRDAFKRPGWGR